MVTSPWPSSRLISPCTCWSTACCSGVASRATRPPSSSGLRPARLDGPAQRLEEPLGVGVDRAEAVLDQPEEVGPHPRDAGELRPVGDLVQRQPQPELAGREGEALLEGEDVGPDVVDDVLVVGVLVLDEQQVVLAEHPGATSSRAASRPRPRRPHRPGASGDGPAEPWSPSLSVSGRSSRGNDAMLARTQPARSVTRARAGPASERRPVASAHQLLGLGRQLLEVGLQRGVVVGLGEGLTARDPDGDPLGQVPCDGVRSRYRLLGYFRLTTLTR